MPNNMTIRIRPLRPLKPSTGTFRRAARQLVQLTSTKPASRPAERERADLEHQLLRILAGGGPRALESVVRTARLLGLDMQPNLETTARGYRAWQQAAPSQNGALEVRGFASRAMRYIRISWRPRPAPLTLTPTQERRHRQQQAFYARYMAAGRRAYASPPLRISAVDRCILLVGELEADVNNGGFSQYLDNKGRRRAGEALKALRRIDASATARLLEAALSPALSEIERSRLDDRFYGSKEDLARLASQTFHLEPNASGSSRIRTSRNKRG